MLGMETMHYCPRCAQRLPERDWYRYADGRWPAYCIRCTADYTRERKYGRDVTAYRAQHDGRCDACGRTDAPELFADHDHATGKFRGLLCQGCNLALGWVNDDAERLMSLIAYIARTSHDADNAA